MAGILLLAGLAAAAYVRVTDRPSAGLDTELAGVSVSTADTRAPVGTTTDGRPPKKENERPERCWTMFGENPQRTLALPDVSLGRPKKAIWARGFRDTMEQAPTFCDGVLYLNLQKSGRTVAVDARTGRTLWERRARGFTVSSPAIAGPRLIVTSIDGTATALDRENGRRLWQVRTSGKVESSPAVVGDTTYFGSTDGRVFAVDVETGKIRWAFDTGGRINSSPSIYGDRLCISTYAGSIFCLRRTNGAKLWSTYVKRDLLRYESFYASPSTDGERVYDVARSGKVVALRASDGRVVWTKHMHSLGYTTPAIAHGRIFVGGYDGRLRAFHTTNGALQWSRVVGAPIAGSPLVVGGLVFFSTYRGKTYAARVGDGRIVWRMNAGQYAPGIATDRMYYFSLNGLLVALRPERAHRRDDR